MSTPHDTPYTITHGPGSGQPAFDGPGYSWAPGSVSDDPHDEGFDDVGDDLDASKVDGPLPENIIRGVIPGPMSRSREQS